MLKEQNLKVDKTTGNSKAVFGSNGRSIEISPKNLLPNGMQCKIGSKSLVSIPIMLYPSDN